MRLMSLDDFIELVNLKKDNFQPGDVFDIQDFNYYTSSFNFETNQIERKKILNIKYQGLKESYELRTMDGIILLTTSENHTLYDFDKQQYVKISDKPTIVVQVYTNNRFEKIECVVVNTHEQRDMYDLEVEGNHNYFTNGILSKNCTGGEAANFFPSTRFRVTPKEQILDKGEVVGITMKIKNYKNKAILNGSPYRECLLNVYFKDGDGYKKGIDGEGQYVDMLIELGILKQHGAWYYLFEDDPNPEKLIKMQGIGGVQRYFKENRELFLQLKDQVDKAMSGFNEVLDKNSVLVDEEVEFRKEQMELQEKREEALKELEKNTENE